MGNVPSWISAGSLLLAFRIFLRDRSRSDRAQVDTVGIWGEIKREAILPGEPRNDWIEFKLCIRNASDLPVEIHQVEFTFTTKWLVPLPEPSFEIGKEIPGRSDIRRFAGHIGIAPQFTWKSPWETVDLAHTAPASDATISLFSSGVKCVIAYALVVDNAGRRWEARQRQGKTAKRIHWYSLSNPHYPEDWQNSIGRRLRAFKAKLKERTRSIRRRSTAAELPEGTGAKSNPASQQ
jgi:hypothetical protein